MKCKEAKLVRGREHWQCSRCGRWLVSDEFYSDKRTPNGLKGQCKRCHTETTILTRNPENTRRLGREHMRRARAAMPELFRERDRVAAKKRDKTSHKVLARKLLNRAVRARQVNKPRECEKCHRQLKLTAHHPDYSKPLVVEWLCYECHGNK